MQYLWCVYRMEVQNDSDALISEDEIGEDTELEEPLPATHDDAGEKTETDTENPGEGTETDTDGPDTTPQQEATGSSSSSTHRRRRHRRNSNDGLIGTCTRSQAKRIRRLSDYMAPPTSCKWAVTRLQGFNKDPCC